jgi:adenine-specific DNA-methyltransferase
MNKIGQYFTTNKTLKDMMNNFILNKPECILEPSVGRGDLVSFLQKKIETTFDMYEIDRTIKILKDVDAGKIIYEDFLRANILKQYKTIVGNPPYVKLKGKNLFIQFVEKCYHLLENNGELIFIVPSEFFKLTASVPILKLMLENGSFTHVYHPNDEKLFEGANVDVLLFRYYKNGVSSTHHEILYNNEKKIVVNNDGFVTFTDAFDSTSILLSNYFDVYVGLVSGKESILKNTLGNIEILNSKGKADKYIFIEKFPSTNRDIDKYLLKNKEHLINRKIRVFNEKNWFQFGAKRNLQVMKSFPSLNCIYIHNLTRKKEVAFVGKTGYFGSNLIMLLPKDQNVDLIKIVNYFNSNEFQKYFIYAGRFKIGQRQLLQSMIPGEILKITDQVL